MVVRAEASVMRKPRKGRVFRRRKRLGRTQRRWRVRGDEVRLQKTVLSQAPALQAALRTEAGGLASLLLLMGR